MVRKHMKRCSTLLIIKNMKIKATVRYHLASTGQLDKKRSEHRVLVRIWRHQNLHTLPAGVSNGKYTVENKSGSSSND